MPVLAQQRCFHHAQRPASARCPQCGRFFCRECVTEHGGQVVCAGCLRKATAGPAKQRLWPGRLALALGVAAGLVLAWLAFLSVGEWLLTLPSQFHQGTIWQ